MSRLSVLRENIIHVYNIFHGLNDRKRFLIHSRMCTYDKVTILWKSKHTPSLKYIHKISFLYSIPRVHIYMHEIFHSKCLPYSYSSSFPLQFLNHHFRVSLEIFRNSYVIISSSFEWQDVFRDDILDCSLMWPNRRPSPFGPPLDGETDISTE